MRKQTQSILYCVIVGNDLICFDKADVTDPLGTSALAASQVLNVEISKERFIQNCVLQVSQSLRWIKALSISGLIFLLNN